MIERNFHLNQIVKKEFLLYEKVNKIINNKKEKFYLLMKYKWNKKRIGKAE